MQVLLHVTSLTIIITISAISILISLHMSPYTQYTILSHICMLVMPSSRSHSTTRNLLHQALLMMRKMYKHFMAP